jgi:nitrogen fixation protein FixH
MTEARPPFEVKGRHVLIGVVVFFGLIMVIDGVFVALALKSHPGEVAVTPYEDGLAYNRTLDERRTQAGLGWSVAVDSASGPGVVRVRVYDRSRAPLAGLELGGRMTRPATGQGAIELAFAETAPGLYEARARPETGAWDVAIVATDSEERRFEAERRLMWR